MFKKKKQPLGRSRSSIKSTLNQPANFSSRKIDNDLLEDKVKKQSKKSSIIKTIGQKFGLLILIIVGLICLVNVLALSSNAKINYLKTDGQTGQLRDINEYQQYASEVLGSSIFNSNKLTFNEANASKTIAEHFPEITSVIITIPFLSHRPIVNIQPAVATLILDSGQGAYVVADNGKAVVKASSAADLSKFNLPVVKDPASVTLASGKLLPSSTVNFVKEVNAQFMSKQLKITEMTLPANNSELDLRVDGKPYFIKFNLQKDNPREQAGSALATMNYLARRNITPSQYIDVRVAGRAYYK